MEEISIKIPEELAEELRELSEIEKSLLITKLVKEKLGRLVRLKKIVSKSQLSEKSAQEISDQINESLSKRYESL